MRTKKWWVTFALSVIVCAAGGCDRYASPVTPIATPSGATPNVLFIVVDALRADHLGVMGYPRDTTPNLDRLSEESLLFTRTYSATSWTMPSLASYMSGLYPSVHGLMKAPHDVDQNSLGPEIHTLAESLRDAGMRTAAITAQPWISDRTGLTQGFDEVQTVSHANDPYEAQKLTARLVDWLSHHDGAPFFLYAHYMGPHSPYNAPPPHQGRFTSGLELPATIAEFHDFYANHDQVRAYAEIVGKAREDGLDPADVEYLRAEYDEKLAFTDEQLGVLLDELRDRGLLDETLLIVTADHGEAFYEHGTVFHGQHLHQELLHVPLMIRLPGAETTPRRIDGIAELIDIYPTIHDLLGLEGPQEIQGQSLVPLMRGERGDGIALAECFGFRITTDGWSSYHKYTMTPERLETLGIESLFNLRDDPLEQRDVLSRRGDVGDRHREMASRLWVQMGRSADYWRPTNDPVELDEDTLERLRSLGYLQ